MVPIYRLRFGSGGGAVEVAVEGCVVAVEAPAVPVVPVVPAAGVGFEADELIAVLSGWAAACEPASMRFTPASVLVRPMSLSGWCLSVPSAESTKSMALPRILSPMPGTKRNVSSSARRKVMVV